MKTVILCGGRGTRLGEHGKSLPKALIEIGGRPIIWHLLKLYSHYGYKDFILCLGYLGDEIKRYFLEHHWLDNDFTLQMNSGGDYQLEKHQTGTDDWRITFVDTGVDTNTGGRIKQIEKYIGNDETFCATYGDGLSDLNLHDLVDFHQKQNYLATLTAVHPLSNFGIMKLDNDDSVVEFQEKPRMEEWINGGFFVFNRKVFEYLEESSVLEREPLERLANERQLIAYKHTGFWKCMDTYKDNMEFNQLWDSEKAAWKVW